MGLTATLRNTQAEVALSILGGCFQKADSRGGILDELHHLGLNAKNIFFL